MKKSKNMAKNGRKVTRKGRLVLNPRGSVHSKRAAKKLDAFPKSHKHAQGIVHDGVVRGHTTVFDTGAQKSMIGWYGWGIIKQNGTCIDARGVNMGGTSKAGR